jgi:beta-glucosidase
VDISYEAAYNLDDFSLLQDCRARVSELAKASDAILLVVGEKSRLSGEASNRSHIGLPGEQVELAKILLQSSSRIVVILMNGRPLALPWIASEMPVILESWFLGIEMGNAVADVLFGDYNPSGKLPVTFPRATGQIPVYYNHKNTGRPPEDNDYFTSKYLDVSWTPQFPFGYGLSYSRFEISNITLDKNRMMSSNTIKVTVSVKNISTVAGHEVLQMYIKDQVRSLTPPVKELRGFKKVFLEPGETRSVSFEITLDDLKFFDGKLNHIAEPGWFSVMIGNNSENVIAEHFELLGN